MQGARCLNRNAASCGIGTEIGRTPRANGVPALPDDRRAHNLWIHSRSGSLLAALRAQEIASTSWAKTSVPRIDTPGPGHELLHKLHNQFHTGTALHTRQSPACP